MFKNIAVAFITHKVKERSFFAGLAIAKAFRGKVTVIELVYRKPPKFVFFETKNDKKAVEEQKKAAQKSLNRFERIAEQEGTKIKTKTAVTESISEWIIEYVKEYKIDLLVIDHPHLSTFEENHYDYIMKKITDKIKIPILLLRS